MTKEEYRRIVEIYGKDFSWFDIPTYIRQRDKADEDLPGWDEWQEEKEKYEKRN